MNDQSAQSCSFCGYLFEDFATGAAVNSTSPSKNNVENDKPGELNTVPNSFEQSADSTSFTPASNSGQSPYFVVKKSIFSSIASMVVYLGFLLLVSVSSGFSIYSVALVLVFILVSIIPNLYTPRRYEFYDSSMVMHRTVGADKEIPYSELSFLDSPMGGGRQQIVLSQSGGQRRRPIIIGKNPSSEQLGMDLKTFLNMKLNKNPARNAIPDKIGSKDQQDSTNEDPGSSLSP
jgi:hypothetical protein